MPEQSFERSPHPRRTASRRRTAGRKLALPAVLMLVGGTVALPRHAQPPRATPSTSRPTREAGLLSPTLIRSAIADRLPGVLTGDQPIDYVLILVDSHRNVVSAVGGHGAAEAVYGGDSSGRCAHWVHVDDASRVTTSDAPGAAGAAGDSTPSPIGGTMQLLLAPRPAGGYAPVSFTSDMHENACGAASTVSTASGFPGVAPFAIETAEGQHYRSGDLGPRPLDVIVAMLKP